MMKLYFWGHLIIFVRLSFASSRNYCQEELDSVVSALNKGTSPFVPDVSSCRNSPEKLQEMLPRIWRELMNSANRESSHIKTLALETVNYIRLVLENSDSDEHNTDVPAGSQVCRWKTFDEDRLLAGFVGVNKNDKTDYPKIRYFERVLNAVAGCDECDKAVSEIYQMWDIDVELPDTESLSPNSVRACEDIKEQDVKNIWKYVNRGGARDKKVEKTLTFLRNIVKKPPLLSCIVAPAEASYSGNTEWYSGNTETLCTSHLNRGQMLIVHSQSLLSSIASSDRPVYPESQSRAGNLLAPIKRPVVGQSEPEAIKKDSKKPKTKKPKKETKPDNEQASNNHKPPSEAAPLISGPEGSMRIPAESDDTATPSTIASSDFPDDPSELTEIINRMMKMAENVNDYATKVSEIGVTAAHAATLVQVLASLGELASRCLDQINTIDVDTKEIDNMIGMTLAALKEYVKQ